MLRSILRLGFFFCIIHITNEINQSNVEDIFIALTPVAITYLSFWIARREFQPKIEDGSRA